MTFDVFSDEPIEDEQPPEEVLEDENGNPIPKPRKRIEEKFPKFVFIKEVVREPRMHYFKVPKLGSYLAIRMEYDSCLFEGALDSAIVEFIELK